jgi:hypothetical protein
MPAAVTEVEAKFASEFKIKKAEYDAKNADIAARQKKTKKEVRKKRKREKDEFLDVITKKPKNNVPDVSTCYSPSCTLSRTNSQLRYSRQRFSVVKLSRLLLSRPRNAGRYHNP